MEFRFIGIELCRCLGWTGRDGPSFLPGSKLLQNVQKIFSRIQQWKTNIPSSQQKDLLGVTFHYTIFIKCPSYVEHLILCDDGDTSSRQC